MRGGGAIMALLVSGLEEVMNKIESMGKKVEAVQNKVVNAQSEILLETMKNTIQVDSGKTRDSLKSSNVLTRYGEKYKLVGAYKSNRAHIVRYLERGCRRWKGKKYPFLRPSFYKSKQEMIEASKQVIEKELKG